jgi:hypothetical protein
MARGFTISQGYCAPSALGGILMWCLDISTEGAKYKLRLGIAHRIYLWARGFKSSQIFNVVKGFTISQGYCALSALGF